MEVGGGVGGGVEAGEDRIGKGRGWQREGKKGKKLTPDI